MQAQIERNIAKKLQHFLGVGNVVGVTILRGNRVGTVIYNVIVIKALVLDCPRDVLGGLGIDGILVFVKSGISFIIAKEGLVITCEYNSFAETEYVLVCVCLT